MCMYFTYAFSTYNYGLYPSNYELKFMQLCQVKNKNEWNKNPGQAEPSNARNLHAYLLAEGCKSDWTVLLYRGTKLRGK